MTHPICAFEKATNNVITIVIIAKSLPRGPLSTFTTISLCSEGESEPQRAAVPRPQSG